MQSINTFNIVLNFLLKNNKRESITEYINNVFVKKKVFMIKHKYA